MKWYVGLLVIIAVLALGGLIAAWVSGLLFERRIDDLRERMIASQGAVTGQAASPPEIMRAFAVKAGGTLGGAAVLYARHKAHLVTNRGQPPLAIEAEQWTGTRTPGLVWEARGVMMGLPVRVVDAYVEGNGLLEARLGGAVRVAGGSGPEFAKGELMRYLSELPFHPDAILNARGLAWRQLDERTVEVTAQSAHDAATVRFLFDAAGDIVGMEADDRPMAEGNAVVPRPWHGTYARYAQFGAYRIPSYGEVGWVLEGGFFTYWQGEVVAYAPLE